MKKTIDVLVKIAGLIITCPVTLGIAGQLFADVQSLALRLLVQLAALAVVEGVFLSAWWALDTDRASPTAVKTRHAITALAMYVGLWILAIQHGEGLAGIVFRLALGLALAGSIYDSGVYTAVRQNAAVDRSAMNDRKVKRHARALACQVAFAELDANATIDLQRIALAQQAGLSSVKREACANLEQIDDRFPYPIDTARRKHVDGSAKRRAKLMPQIEQLAAAGMTKADIGRAVGLSRQTVGLWLQDIAVPAPTNGNRHGLQS
jgi:hypothetical protein